MSHLIHRELEVSSEDDEDYRPSDEEEESDNVDEDEGMRKKRKRSITAATRIIARKRKDGIKLDVDNSEQDEDVNEDQEDDDVDEITRKEDTEIVSERVKKLWEGIKEDTKLQEKERNSCLASYEDMSEGCQRTGGTVDKKSITEDYKLAEEEAKKNSGTSQNVTDSGVSLSSKSALIRAKTSDVSAAIPIKKRCLGNILGQLGKQQKSSTLEQSKLNWSLYKTKEGIEEELQYHNKDGYLNRQDFLRKVDEKQYEIEKSLRFSSRRKF